MRSRTLRVVLATIALAAGLLVLLLATDLLGGESEAEKASARVCDARDDIAEQVRALQGLTLTTATTDKISESVQAIRADLSTIADARDELSDERRGAVDAANEEFTAAVQEIAGSVGSSVSVADAATRFKQAVADLSASYRSTFGTLECE